MAGQHYCLRWNNYQSNMTSVFHQLLRTEAFVDVTLACNDETLKAHKVVLSACSSYFQKLLLDNPCRHPTIIMPQDVCFSDLKFIIEFVYKGEIDVSQAQLQSLLKTADQLKIKGLCEVPEGSNNKDMVGAEVTPLPLSNHSPVTATRRNFSKFRRLSITAKRKLDTRRQLYRAQLQKQQQEEEQRRLQQEQQEQMIQTVVTTIHEPQQHNQMQSPDSLTSCITVATSTEDDHKTDVPVVILESRIHNQHQHSSPPHHHHHHTADAIMMTSPQPIMSTHALPPTQIVLDPSSVNVHSSTEVDMPSEPQPQPTAPVATLVSNIKLPDSPTHTDISVDTALRPDDSECVKVKFETLRAMDQSDQLDMDSHLSDRNMGEEEPEHAMHTMMITPELLGLIPSSSVQQDLNGDTNGMKREPNSMGAKTWTQEDMDNALEALRSHSMSLTKASITFGIPSTTLWQRAHRLGIDTPKKDGPAKSWTEDVLNVALEALRNGTISANKASKAYGIPSSTLYKIARREGIRLAAPFNAAPTTWNPEDLERALEAIRSGQTTVQRAATEYGIPSGTLYGRCKREGIELSRSNPTPWSEDAMIEALEAVRMGQMSINQAAIHYNLPYSSLYGRFKRCKYEADHPVENEEVNLAQHHTISPQIMLVQYQQTPTQLQMYQHTPS